MTSPPPKTLFQCADADLRLACRDWDAGLSLVLARTRATLAQPPPSRRPDAAVGPLGSAFRVPAASCSLTPSRLGSAARLPTIPQGVWVFAPSGRQLVPNAGLDVSNPLSEELIARYIAGTPPAPRVSQEMEMDDLRHVEVEMCGIFDTWGRGTSE